MTRKTALLMTLAMFSLLSMAACERRGGSSDTTTVRVRTGTDTVRDTIHDTVHDTVRTP